MADLHSVRAMRAPCTLADDLERAADQTDAPQLVLPVLSRRALGLQNRADLCR